MHVTWQSQNNFSFNIWYYNSEILFVVKDWEIRQKIFHVSRINSPPIPVGSIAQWVERQSRNLIKHECDSRSRQRFFVFYWDEIMNIKFILWGWFCYETIIPRDDIQWNKVTRTLQMKQNPLVLGEDMQVSFTFNQANYVRIMDLKHLQNKLKCPQVS